MAWTLAGGRSFDIDVGMGGMGGQVGAAVPTLVVAWAFLSTSMGEWARTEAVEKAVLRCATSLTVPVRPSMRGVQHRIAAPVFASRSSSSSCERDTAGDRLAMVVYGVCVTAMLAVSAAYHSGQPSGRRRCGCSSGSTTPRSSSPSPARTRA